jgi:hypothetical protein
MIELNRPISTHDLKPTELELVRVMQKLGFGRIEMFRVQGGNIVLEPNLRLVRNVKFGVAKPDKLSRCPEHFELKASVADLFEHLRGLKSAEIRVLEVRHGLPSSMDVAEM